MWPHIYILYNIYNKLKKVLQDTGEMGTAKISFSVHIIIYIIHYNFHR